ncbi:hypothetical protein B4U80_13007 [Leptotrombidium deliense]|uniref:Chromo shadow domain-containing protein n=1 Tax=Leptotrombidium deliense TaxID=299467 RepID=A0A443SF24_9ACAR|nr:hypothetical protein B4U80_13007 [Leptotrombidium deliense]
MICGFRKSVNVFFYNSALEEHNYFSPLAEDRHDVNVDSKNFKLKAELLKKKLNERQKLALGFGGKVLSASEQSATNSKSNEEEIKQMLSAKTGLDRGLIPAKVVAVQEYKGILLHLVEWTDLNEELEAIPSPILSANYPQVVIEFYQSRAVMCDTFTGKERALKNS